MASKDVPGQFSTELDEWLLQDLEVGTEVARVARAFASLVRTTYGPRGQLKLVETEALSGGRETVLTSDAGTILDAVEQGDGFQHPFAAMVLDGIDSQRRSVHDGTTRAVLLTDGLIREGTALVDEGLHPNTVAIGYSLAAARAGQTLDELAVEVSSDDEALLECIAATSMTNLTRGVREQYAAVTATAVQRLAAAAEDGWIDTDDLDVHSRRGIGESELFDGLVVTQGPRQEGPNETERVPEVTIENPIRDATVVVTRDEFDPASTATTFGGGMSSARTLGTVDGATEYADQVDAERRGVVDRLAELGVDLLLVEDSVADRIGIECRTRGIHLVDDVQKADLRRAATLTGAPILSSARECTPEQLGTVDKLAQRQVGEERWTVLERPDAGALTLVVNVQTDIAAKAVRGAVSNAIEVTTTAVIDNQILPGAGAPESAVAADLREYATSLADREQLAVEAFATALEDTVAALAENVGQDPLDARTALRTAHTNSARTARSLPGLRVESDTPASAWDHGVVEPRRTLSQALETARELSERLLTVDALIAPNVDLDSVALQTEHN